MKIDETFTVNAAPERVWDFITDPEEVAPCIPGCGDVEVGEDGEYRASVKVAIGPIRTSFNVSIRLTELTAPSHVAAVTRGEEGGKASTLAAHSELFLNRLGPGRTEVRYLSEVSVVGRLGKFGLGMMKKKAKRMGADFAESFTARVEGAARGQAIETRAAS